MKSAILYSIREKATRLPKKVLRVIHGKTVCEHTIDRLRLARRPDMIVMTTSTHPEDDVLCSIAERTRIPFYRGSAEDKLDRYLNTALSYDIDRMVIVDGDDLFCSEEHIDETIRVLEETSADYVSQEGLPIGTFSHGIRLSALETVCRLKLEKDTEVWGGYFTDTGLFDVRIIDVSDPLLRRPDIRMTLDYQEDLMFIQAVFDGLYRKGKIPTIRQVLSYVTANPWIITLNQGAQEKYLANLAKAAPVRMRMPE